MYLFQSQKSRKGFISKIERSLFISGLNYIKYQIFETFIFFEIITNNQNEITKIKQIINKHNITHYIFKNIYSVHSFANNIKKEYNLHHNIKHIESSSIINLVYFYINENKIRLNIVKDGIVTDLKNLN